VNDISLENVKHDDAVNVLRTAGDEVTLRVKHCRAALPFLAKTFQRPKERPVSGEDPTYKLKDEDDWKVGQKSPKTPQGASKMERRWVDVMTIHLLMAYLTRYMLDTDKLRFVCIVCYSSIIYEITFFGMHHVLLNANIVPCLH
ncbi:hypothetical protein AVEN_164165-1, partial [Araneus ventricosus]